MDEEMEDFIGDCSSPTEIDLDYEFDAAQFFDFTQPESFSEAQEAERWFESASSYPPSPLIVKLNWSKCIPVVEVTSSPSSGAGGNSEHMCNNSDVDIDPEVPRLEEKAEGRNYNNRIAQDIPKVKMKSAYQFKPRSSTLMKPTASQLAKQKKARDLYSSRFCGRAQKPSTRVDDKSLQNIPGFENLATKRQKLECGFLCKVAHLKHHTPLLHKTSKKVGQNDVNSLHSRSKVTIPKEPELETAQRAQRRSFRSKNNSKSSENAKSNFHAFKARPLNRKILEAPLLPLPKKSTPQPPEFHMFHLKTLERAMQHSSANPRILHKPDYVMCREEVELKRLNPEDAMKQEKCEPRKFKASATSKKIFPLKGDAGLFRQIREEALVPNDFRFPSHMNLLENPPIELFNKLTLESESKNNTTYQSKQHLSTKGSKENVPSPFQLEYL
ncbi:hypothetical protein LguiB_003572 [Lonicera macranthoides]